MRAQEYASWDNPRFAPMREPMRRVMEAYGNAEKWFADIKDRVLCDMGMPFLSDAIHRLEHKQPERIDEFAEIPHDYHLRLMYPGTPELDEDFDNDLDRVFEVCVAIVDGVNEALGGFIRATADGEFNALSLKAEELQIANTDDRRKLLDAWTMWDQGGMSRATFDSWCRKLFEGGEDE